MKCPRCKEFDNRVLETRKQSNVVWRRRYCQACTHIFFSSETVVLKFPTNVWKTTLEKTKLFRPKRKTTK